MLYRSLFVSFALLSSCLCAVEGPALKDPKQVVPLQVQHLDNLIYMTQETLKNLQSLSTQLKEYQAIQERYLANTKDAELLYRMVKSAQRLNENIKSSHLSHSFDPDFISELNLLSQIAQKVSIPKPDK